MQTLRDLFQHEFKAMYYTEHKLSQALLEMVQESSAPDIQGAFHKHWIETQAQVERLDTAFNILGDIPTSAMSLSVDGLVNEKKSYTTEAPPPMLLDLYNLTAGIKSERLEISGYEALIPIARQLGMSQVAELLQANLQEEEVALRTLIGLRNSYNLSALGGGQAPSAAEPGFDAQVAEERPRSEIRYGNIAHGAI